MLTQQMTATTASCTMPLLWATLTSSESCVVGTFGNQTDKKWISVVLGMYMYIDQSTFLSSTLSYPPHTHSHTHTCTHTLTYTHTHTHTVVVTSRLPGGMTVDPSIELSLRETSPSYKSCFKVEPRSMAWTL